MLDVAPVQWRVIRTVRPKYSCRSCEKIVQAPAPVKAIARGKASFATLAQPPDLRRQRRQEMTRPLIDELRVVIDDALRRLSPKAAMAKALAYGRKRWPALTRFVENGSAEIDNNIAERAMRSIAIGRKNWLFAGSKAGGERAAAIYSVIETCLCRARHRQVYAERRTMPSTVGRRPQLQRTRPARAYGARHSLDRQRAFRNPSNRSSG